MYHVYNNLWNKTIVAPTTTTSDYHRGDMHSSIVRGWRVCLCVHPPTTKYLGILGSPCTNISVAHDTTMDSLVSLSLVQPARAVHQFGFGILLAHALPLLLCCVLVEHQRSVVAVKVQHSSTTDDDRPPPKLKQHCGRTSRAQCTIEEPLHWLLQSKGYPKSI